MSLRNSAVVTIWCISNVIGLGLIAFSDRPLVKLVAVLYESAAISISGLVSIGSMFCKYEPDATMADIDERLARMKERYPTDRA